MSDQELEDKRAEIAVQLRGHFLDNESEIATLLAERGFQNAEYLSEGGMGTVYLAVDAASGRKVAIKLPDIVAEEGSPLYERFKRECEMATQLRHPNVVATLGSAILSTKKGSQVPYLIMEYVAGDNLRQLMGRRTLSRGQITQIVVQLCDALAHAHKMGIIHRDIKPENVLVDEDGNVRLADFGIALDLTSKERLTTNGNIPHTRVYAAPEIVLGCKEMDDRADVYSCGALVCEMLTGTTPRDDEALLNKWPPELANWQGVITKSTSLRPAERYKNVLSFRRAVTGAHYADVVDAILQKVDTLVLLSLAGLHWGVLVAAALYERVLSGAYASFLIWAPFVMMVIVGIRRVMGGMKTAQVDTVLGRLRHNGPLMAAFLSMWLSDVGIIGLGLRVPRGLSIDVACWLSIFLAGVALLAYVPAVFFPERESLKNFGWQLGVMFIGTPLTFVLIVVMPAEWIQRLLFGRSEATEWAEGLGSVFVLGFVTMFVVSTMTARRGDIP